MDDDIDMVENAATMGMDVEMIRANNIIIVERLWSTCISLRDIIYDRN